MKIRIFINYIHKDDLEMKQDPSNRGSRCDGSRVVVTDSSHLWFRVPYLQLDDLVDF